MKTKLMLLTWLFMVALFFGQSAQAFYNPQTGRWLSRDPLGDESFLREQTKGKGWRAQKHLVDHGNLPSYLFVKNSPIDQFDPRGLKQIWGNWCGSYWTGGKEIESTQYDWENDPSPAVKDGLDACCRTRCLFCELGPR